MSSANSFAITGHRVVLAHSRLGGPTVALVGSIAREPQAHL